MGGTERLGVNQARKCWSLLWGSGISSGLCRNPCKEATGRALNWTPSRRGSLRNSTPTPRYSPKALRKRTLPDNYFDAVVGNVPFGDYAVHDPSMKRSLTRSIHDYFFAKSLEKVRPGGIMALITSRYTMDKKDDMIRKAPGGAGRPGCGGEAA